MKNFLIFILLCLCQTVEAQVTLSGTLIDDVTSKPIEGAKIKVQGINAGAFTNDEGAFTISLQGKLPVVLISSFLGYSNLETTLSSASEPIIIRLKKDKDLVGFFAGEGQELEEVKVIGNLAIDRKTPVAVTRISTKQIAEELGSQDLPMILNSTPGVHATQQGGGDGDARITIRGFDQRNVGVMIDGVPVNDMENGAVYWSNWFGLDAITGQIQVQRGLGATKLAMPSVGGTMNILTQATGGKRMIRVAQEYGT